MSRSNAALWADAGDPAVKTGNPGPGLAHDGAWRCSNVRRHSEYRGSGGPVHRPGKRSGWSMGTCGGGWPPRRSPWTPFLRRPTDFISTRPHHPPGRELGMLTVLRVFAIDSKAVSNLGKERDRHGGCHGLESRCCPISPGGRGCRVPPDRRGAAGGQGRCHAALSAGPGTSPPATRNCGTCDGGVSGAGGGPCMRCF